MTSEELATGHGVVTRLENLVTPGLDKAKTSIETSITTKQRDLAEANTGLGAAFPQQQELNDARARLADIDARIGTQAAGPNQTTPETGSAPEPEQDKPPGFDPEQARAAAVRGRERVRQEMAAVRARSTTGDAPKAVTADKIRALHEQTRERLRARGAEPDQPQQQPPRDPRRDEITQRPPERGGPSLR